MSTHWGILSTGHIAESFARDLVHVPDARLTAVTSRTVERAEQFAATFGSPRVHASLEALAADPEVEVVYVAGIHPVHRDHAIAMMRAGKHVLVEKPLAMNADEVAEMVAVSRETDRFLMEAMWMRFNPLHVEVQRRIAAGEFGAVQRIESDFSFAAPRTPTHRLFDPAKGGGSLLDVGIYPLTLAWWWLGAPTSWSATGEIGPTGVDESVTLDLGWSGGATARLTCGSTRDGSRESVIRCDEAVITIPAPAHASPVARIATAGGTETVTCAAAGLHHQVVEVHRCLAAGLTESPRMSHADSHAVAGFMDSVLASLHGA
ncbi:MAG: Gfo/Idh/MocA family protein [Ilumatobacteraceae bacterium]